MRSPPYSKKSRAQGRTNDREPFDEASFISGCDLRVDGGSTAVLKLAAG